MLISKTELDDGRRSVAFAFRRFSSIKLWIQVSWLLRCADFQMNVIKWEHITLHSNAAEVDGIFSTSGWYLQNKYHPTDARSLLSLCALEL